MCFGLLLVAALAVGILLAGVTLDGDSILVFPEKICSAARVRSWLMRSDCGLLIHALIFVAGASSWSSAVIGLVGLAPAASVRGRMGLILLATAVTAAIAGSAITLERSTWLWVDF